jgi:hypothetical protein
MKNKRFLTTILFGIPLVILSTPREEGVFVLREPVVSYSPVFDPKTAF